MLTGITLENFKAFKDPQFIPIRPITLVFGPNSAGKSSIVHALAFLKYVYYSNGHCDPDVVDYGSDKIQLGSWHNLVHGHDETATMRITLHFETGRIMWAFKNEKYGPRVDSFVLYDHGKPIARGDNQEKDQNIPKISWSVELHACHPYWQEFRETMWGLASGEYEANVRADESARESGLEADAEYVEFHRDQSKQNFRQNFRSIFDAHLSDWLGDSWKKLPDGGMTNLFPAMEKYSGNRFKRMWHGDLESDEPDELDSEIEEENDIPF